MTYRLRLTALILAATLAAPALAPAQEIRTTQGISLFGDVKYGPDFTHFDYVNPDAPKGGTAKLNGIGGFDSLNPFIVKGSTPLGLGNTYDSLMVSSLDEPSTMYGLIAETIAWPDDFSWVEFTLRPEARWHDGQPITADDVIFSFNSLKDKGAPFYRFYYSNVVKAEIITDQKVRFTFSQAGNRELPQIMGQLVVLPKHYWASRDFSTSTLEPPLGSGPYRIGKVDTNRSITYERVTDYWAKDLPVSRGTNNFDQVIYEYFRDQTVALEAFKAGAYDFRAENSAKNWATAYNFPAFEKGLVKRELIPDETGAGMQSFAFNLRRAKFRDRAVRQAISMTFDFEWTNKTLFYGQYQRTRSFFEGSELAATGLPSPDELAILEPYRDQLPSEVFTTEYTPPSTEGASLRRNLRTAQKLLKEAGLVLKGGKLLDADGTPFNIEFLLVSPIFEKVVSPMVQNLKRLGITATIRVVDAAQYERRLDGFEFDIVVASWGQSLSPGNEQRNFWGSDAADRNGSRNWVGIKNPVIDALIERLIFATDRADLITASRALDRVLQWNYYVIPQWNLPAHRLAYWDKFGRPEKLPLLTYGFPSIWWIDAEKAAGLRDAQNK